MKLLTVAEVAEALAISRSLVYDLVNQGQLPYVNVGKSKAYRFVQADIEAFINDRKTRNEGRRPKPPVPRLKHVHL